MLLYYCASEEERAAMRREGIVRDVGVSLWTSLDDALVSCPEGVLVVDASLLEDAVDETAPVVVVPRVAAAAIRNLDPFLPVEPVTAGGGYVMRRIDGRWHVLLIHRRGVWDLPKGKAKHGETPSECALREVGEEVGVASLALGKALGTTVHGYAEDGHYRVKTTHWFRMETAAETFVPQTKEDIDAVAWVAWEEAKQRIGYATLRRHMDEVERKLALGGEEA